MQNSAYIHESELTLISASFTSRGRFVTLILLPVGMCMLAANTVALVAGLALPMIAAFFPALMLETLFLGLVVRLLDLII